MKEEATPAGLGIFDPLAPAGTVPRHNWGWFVFRGILALLLGLVALLAPGVTLFAFALVFAAFAFADGVTQLIAGIRGARHHKERYGGLIFSGLIGVAIGVLFFIWPLLSTLAYALLVVALIALWAISTGIFQVAAAVRMRREIEGEWLLALAGILSLLLGLALIAMAMIQPGVSILSVGWLIALYAFASGISLIVLGFRLKKRQPAD